MGKLTDKEQSILAELRNKSGIDLVAMAVPLVDQFLLVELLQLGVFGQEERTPFAQPHRPAQSLGGDVVLRHIDDNLEKMRK